MGKYMFGGLFLAFITITTWANSRPAGVIIVIVLGGLLLMKIIDNWPISFKWIFKRTPGVRARRKGPCDNQVINDEQSPMV